MNAFNWLSWSFGRDKLWEVNKAISRNSWVSIQLLIILYCWPISEWHTLRSFYKNWSCISGKRLCFIFLLFFVSIVFIWSNLWNYRVWVTTDSTIGILQPNEPMSLQKPAKRKSHTQTLIQLLSRTKDSESQKEGRNSSSSKVFFSRSRSLVATYDCENSYLATPWEMRKALLLFCLSSSFNLHHFNHQNTNSTRLPPADDTSHF